jgi:TonB family protein
MAPLRDDNGHRVRSGDRRTDRIATPPGTHTDPSSPQRVDSPFYSATEETFKTRTKGRFVIATLVALLSLVVIALFGPDRDAVKQKFEIYGAEGPLEIMPQISIDAGSDAVHQIPEPFRQLAPPPLVQVEPVEPEAVPELPIAPELDEPVAVEATDQPDVAYEAAVAQAELTLPRQSNPDFIILKMVRPLYPLDATETERRRAFVRVDVAIFVDDAGRVTAAMITASEGGKVFDEAVLTAMNQWEFAWQNESAPTAGRWIEMTWRFKSPYGQKTRLGGTTAGSPTGHRSVR